MMHRPHWLRYIGSQWGRSSSVHGDLLDPREDPVVGGAAEVHAAAAPLIGARDAEEHGFALWVAQGDLDFGGDVVIAVHLVPEFTRQEEFITFIEIGCGDLRFEFGLRHGFRPSLGGCSE